MYYNTLPSKTTLTRPSKEWSNIHIAPHLRFFIFVSYKIVNLDVPWFEDKCGLTFVENWSVQILSSIGGTFFQMMDLRIEKSFWRLDTWSGFQNLNSIFVGNFKDKYSKYKKITLCFWAEVRRRNFQRKNFKDNFGFQTLEAILSF